MSPVEAATAAAELLEANDWCYGVPALDAAGLSVEPRDPKAVRWSFAGAIDRVTDDIPTRRILINTASKLLWEHAYKWEQGQGKAGVVELFRRIATHLKEVEWIS